MKKKNTHKKSMRKLFLALICALIPAACTKNSLPHEEPSVNKSTETVTTERSTITNNKLLNKSILELQSLVDSGEVNYQQLTQFYLDRIERYNSKLNAVITVNPKALQEAQSRDENRENHKRSALYGIPILIKDNIETDELPTTAGSLLLANNNTKRDAPLIANLKKQGAIILGKTNLSEWANFRSESSSSGWSSIGGQARNPYDLNRTPCGSSAGSGVAVAAQLAPLAIGTETDGSVVCPSSVNGIVGIKPTVGLVSRKFIVPISPSQDTAGPMARTVEDAALLLMGMQQDKAEADDTFALQRPNTIKLDYISAINSIESKNIKIGSIKIQSDWYNNVKEVFNQSLSTLTSSGIQINEIDLEIAENAFQQEYDLLLFEFKHSLNEYLKSLEPPLSNYDLAKLIKMNKADKKNIMPFFKQEIFIKAQAKDNIQSEEYLNLRKELKDKIVKNGLEKYFSENPDIQVLIAPTLTPAWSIDHANGDNYSGSSAGFAAVSGYPSITLPMGKAQGLPVGLSLIARPYQEFEMLAINF